MLEGLAAWILNTYVGEYLENLNTDQLSIGLLQGEVELENLPLRKDALKGLELPVEVHSGFVGKIKLQIPVSRLRSEPWVICIEKLFLIVGPILSSSYDEKAEEEAALARKLARLEVLEAKYKGVPASKQGESYYTNWMSYGTSLMANVVENVQLKIKDVHIRYEDEESYPDYKFACGILIQTLSAQSTDQNWVPTFVRRDQSDFMWKLLQLQGLSFYWDTKTEILSHLDQKSMMAAMAKQLEISLSPGPVLKSHEFILAPVNAEAHLTRNCSVKPLRSRFSPRIICDIHLQKIPLSLSEEQYRQMMGCVKQFEVLDIRWKHRKWRPKVPVKENPRAWWSYAISVHLDPIHKKKFCTSWSYALERARDIVTYSKVYQEWVNKPDMLSSELKNSKDELEKKLNFELLCLLREMAMKKIQRENSGELSAEESKGKGFLQWMFPSWSGWYSNASTTDVSSEENTEPNSMSQVDELKSQLEEEILDVLDNADNDSLLKRDTIFAQLNFSLSQGSFILLQSDSCSGDDSLTSKSIKEKSIIELEFSDVSTKVETRPRTGSFLFEIKLGALYLHDRVFCNTNFPLIIAPQNRDVSFLYSKSCGVTIFPLPSFLSQKSEIPEPNSHLFELSYEKKPFTVHADHKLNITTRALDVVYNPQVLKRVTEFFSLHHDKLANDFSVSELKLTAAARARYEVLKHQTKAELQHKWDQILDGEDKTIYSRGWNVELAISAPQIIIPEDIFDKNSSVVVFDLGKLHFFNARKIDTEESSISEDIDDDEDFITPCSTPQELLEWTEHHNKLMEMIENPNDPQQLKEHIYEKYTLELSNIQVLVSRLKDNWKFAQLRGTSTMHILDRFSITVQTERRMVYTQDPDWPCVALTGNLPKLVVHVSEQKVNALQTCVDLLSSPIGNNVASTSHYTEDKSSAEVAHNLVGKTLKEEKQIISKQLSEGHGDGNESSLLLLMEFCVDQMSFDVQSRGHSVAELQVTGVKTTFSKHPSSMSLTLCVHSLLLVDALQTFGPDFELLLASHKHLSMDSMSGSLRDSEPNSPASPGSPPSPITSPHFVPPNLGATPPSVLSAALSTLQSSKKSESNKKWSSSLRIPKSEHYASDALIIVEFNLVESPSLDCNGIEVLQIASLQFNNLDVIANQETIVELVEFVKRIALQRNKKPHKGRLSPIEELNKSVSEKEASTHKYISKTEITFDFHRLNILLLRALSQKHSSVGQKVATATITGARIQATIGDVIEIQGSLGGLQVLDLITENTKHQKIVSIGYDPLMEQHTDLLSRLQEEMYKPLRTSGSMETNNALTFVAVRGDKMPTCDYITPQGSFKQKIVPSGEQGYLDITLRMASLCYTHSPKLLHELSSCATEFKAYMKSLASSIKSAATEVAMGIVSKRTGSLSATLHGNQFDSLHSLQSRTRFDSTDEDLNINIEDTDDVSVDLRLDILLQTPVVAFPTSSLSPHVLVAHLGRIAIQNSAVGILNPKNFSIDIEEFNENTTVLIEIRDMNMHFVNIEKVTQVSSSSLNGTEIVTPALSVKELYACDDKNQLIIHDTVIEVVVCTDESKSKNIPSSFYEDRQECVPQTKVIDIKGRVVNPLKVVFTKQQFQQMLKVLDNLTYIEDSFTYEVEKSAYSVSSADISLDDSTSFSDKHEESINVNDGFKSLHVSFELPDLIAELRGDLMNREEGIVSLIFQKFMIEYDMEQMYEATLNVTLQTFLMEDLKNIEVSPRCYLMSSVSNSRSSTIPRPPKSKYISVSCPSLSDENSFVYCSPSLSLPDKLNTQNMFTLQTSSRKLSGTRGSLQRSRSKNEDSYPSTPPPSPSGSDNLEMHYSHDALVLIKVTLVDKKSPDFIQKYNKTNRFIDIDFNCLDIILNLQTWVMVLDFFSVGNEDDKLDIPKPSSMTRSTSTVEKKSDVNAEHEITNSEINLKVKSLTVVLNKPEYKLASANISNFTSDMSLRDYTYSIKGTLGSVSLSDLSPHGHIYPEKFVTTGSEALHYHIFKYSRQIPNLQTDYDLSVKCQMCSVQYVHTQRFLSEVTAFFRQFHEMQELIWKIRLATSGAIVNVEAARGLRILLDISAGSPVIVIPQSSSSSDVLVADLGKITVRNTFLTAGSKGTISYCKRFVDTHAADNKEFEFNSTFLSDVINKKKSEKAIDENNHMSEINEFLSNEHQCLLDVINVELTDMDIYSAVHFDQCGKRKRKNQSSLLKTLDFPSFAIKKKGNDLLQQKFMLQVQVERNLDSAISHNVPDWAIEGVVSSVHVTLDKEQYKLILGVLNQNLGEPLEEFTFDVGNETDPFVLMDAEDKAWTTMAIHMDLLNVTLELFRNDGIVNKPGECPLAKFDFMRSRLCYESFSDGSSDIDLVSNMVQVSDIRYKDAPVNSRPNVFTKILQPIKKKESCGSALQAEVHYRITHDFSRFTVLLNNMRVMGVFDFLQSVLNFLTVTNGGETNKPYKNESSDKTYHPQKAPVNKSHSNFEMKINVTDTELVVVEDTSLWDSNAVILKTTAVVAWKPDFVDKPLSCNLQSLEVFSCILGVEDDTALSIIDPLTVSLEIVRKLNSPLIQLESCDPHHIIELSVMNLNLRLSYYDMTMFIKIFESIKKQLSFQPKSLQAAVEKSYSASDIDCLVVLGFSVTDCENALTVCKGNVNDAAIWLTQNATPRCDTISDNTSSKLVSDGDKQAKQINVTAAEIRITSCCLCIIDDCRDADVPVVELSFSDITFVHKFLAFPEGNGSFTFNSDYYNRALSGWEPVIEPWKCCIKWKIQPFHAKPGKKVVCSVSSVDPVNFNVTSSLIDLYKNVKKNWTEDYLHSDTRNKELNPSDMQSPGCYRRRLPFMPFALKNNTGCKLWFSTQITSAEEQTFDLESQNIPENNKFGLSWTEVPAGNIIPMPFESRSKMRHKDSHSRKLHQIIVKVDGWLPVAPVSVDRVGTYFRHASPQKSHSASAYCERPSARIVFVVALEGSARKIITVESALLIENRLEDTIELKLENSGMQYGVRALSLYLIPHESMSIPLQFVHAQIWARPVDKQVAFCNHSITWQHVSKTEDIQGTIKKCSSLQRASEFYRFLVVVKRRKFPATKESSSSNLPFVQPAHKIYILPCLEIVNLLPYELHFSIKNFDINGYIKAGKGRSIHAVDVSEQFYLKFFLENFKRCKDICLSTSSRHYPSRIELCDNLDRLLILQLKVFYLPGGALKLYVTAPYWLVNKTGLPLVFKQEGTNIEAAGQQEEHELARCMAPLLFSFADREASAMCNMRVGRSLHSDGIPQWCYRFDMEKGIRVRRLHIVRKDGRPDWVYNIGIDVRIGRGRYSDTHIVTLSPRYQLDNRTSHKLEFCQRFAAKENRRYVLTAMPKSSLPFHWPRIDLDNLLCVRQTDINDCHWSGGFSIDSIKSFHINMRDGQGKSNFLRVEIVLQNATFFIVFTDADGLPPPFRIDNHSEVSIMYYQTNVEEERLKTNIRPRSSIPYAFDEPTLPPYITLCAPGGSASTYNMNIFREGNQLYYENFIYIAFTGTFNDGLNSAQSHNLIGKEYVLDVPYGNKVVINKREASKRSQLWRMTSTGMLQHEGSSPPRDPHKPNAVDPSKIFVLDISGLSPQPGEYISLMIRKPDPRRKHTQTWKFTSDGRLCCAYPNMYVQSKDGFKGLRRGNDVVLGPSMPVNYVTMENGIPLEQAISRRKLRGGSGVLTVKVTSDGPTRVLLITDIKKQQIISRSSYASDWVVYEEQDKNDENSPVSECEILSSPISENDIEIEVCIQLSAGLGLSVINHLSEELIYIWLHNIMVQYNKTSKYHTLCGSIKDIQIDNQLREAEKPVMLYVSEYTKADDHQRHLPALHFTLQQICTPVINAEIFKHFIVTIKNLMIMLEERLLLKLLQFAGLDQTDTEVEKMDESENNQSQRSISETMAYEKRYYFSTLKLYLKQIKLSVLTSSNLPNDLLLVKRNMRLKLIRFEDAVIELDPFIRIHPFETADFLIDSIFEHYKEELKSQAAKILGAVDFLGNPLGLVNDVSDGLSKFIHEGNVGFLIKNVTHGLSDSAAKLSGSLSDGLGVVAMDDKHQKKRKEIRPVGPAPGSEHIIAGLKGLGFGILGGVTSVFTQTYEGAVQEGVHGFFSGLGKGIVGTVTKPTIGFLDFASGAASAVRDTSKGNTYSTVLRTRPPRICVGTSGLLPRYSHQQALGQDFLYNLNNRNYNELFIAKEQIRSGAEDLHALISSEQVYFLSSGSPSSSNIVLTVPFTDLYKCCYVCSGAGVIGEIRHYLQLIMKADNSMGSITVSNDPLGRRHSRNHSLEPLCKKPQVRCDSEEIAKKVVMQINYAKSLHEERTYMVTHDENSDEERE